MLVCLQSLYDFSATTIDGAPCELSTFRDSKVQLVVNVASF
jgi:glutathione peroxidase-family protein